MFGMSWPRSATWRTTFLLHAAAGKDGQPRAEDGRGQVNPQMCKMPGNQRWRDRSGGVHRSAGDGSGEHRFQSDYGSNGDTRRYPFLLRADGNAENHKYERARENGFEDERLEGRTCRLR